MKWSFTTWKKLKSGGSGGDGERRKSNVIPEGARSRRAGGARRQGSPARAHAEGDPRPHTSCETLQHGDKRRGGADFQRRRGVIKGEEIRNGTGLLNGHTAGEKTTKRHPRHPRGKTFSDMPPLTNVTSHAPPPGFQKQGLRHTNRREEITPNYRKVKTTRTAITEGGAKRGPCHDTGDPWERHAGRKEGHVPHCHLHGPSWPGPGFRGEGGWRGGQ